jgi:hypothetical protein
LIRSTRDIYLGVGAAATGWTMLALMSLPKILVLIFLIALVVVCMRFTRRNGG